MCLSNAAPAPAPAHTPACPHSLPGPTTPYLARPKGISNIHGLLTHHLTPSGRVQGATTLQPISRFQAAAVGSKIYIHTHRSLADILVLDVANADQPQLDKVPVSSTTGITPSAR